MNIDEPLAAGFVLPGRGTKRPRQGTESTIVNRLPILRYLPRHFRSHFIAMCGEFIGTFLFLFFAFSGTQVANTQVEPQTSTTVAQASNPAQLLYISLCFGFSLAVNAWVFFRISGGLFNPAVTLGMCLVGALSYIRGVLLALSQILGAIAAAAVVSVLFPGPLDVRTALRIGTSITRGLFIEMFLTTQLVFTIFMLAAEKHKATFIAPVGIGLSLFIAELTGVFYTGGSLNPARSFGPDVVLHTFHRYHWIYWLGPILGSLLASAFYRFMKMLEYETANPGADFDEHEKEHFGPTLHNSRPPATVNLSPSNQQQQEHDGATKTITGAEADHYDPDGVITSPGNHTAGQGRHRRMSALRGGRKEPGFSPAEASQKETEDLTDVYDAAPGAERGSVSTRG